MSLERSITFRTAPNIALVKYWGKRDKQQNLPLNSSISLTLDNVLSIYLDIHYRMKFTHKLLYHFQNHLLPIVLCLMESFLFHSYYNH